MDDEALPESPYEVPADQVEAICALVARVPELDGVLAAHLADYDEVLPHVLINDLARSYVTAVADGEIDTTRKLVVAVEFLGASPEQGVRALLVEFISGLVAGAGRREHAAVAAMRPLMGPATADTLDRVLRQYGVG
jgi:hypothetical protein